MLKPLETLRLSCGLEGTLPSQRGANDTRATLLFFQGHYDGVIFHRVVPDFLVQTGDRTGTGGGGESFYGGV